MKPEKLCYSVTNDSSFQEVLSIMSKPSFSLKGMILTLIRLILILIILICLWQIGSTLWGYRQGTQAYQSLREQAAAPAQG